MPFALTDHQLQLVLAACQPLAPEMRIVLMERDRCVFEDAGPAP
jgi:hypothetical protein